MLIYVNNYLLILNTKTFKKLYFYNKIILLDSSKSVNYYKNHNQLLFVYFNFFFSNNFKCLGSSKLKLQNISKYGFTNLIFFKTFNFDNFNFLLLNSLRSKNLSLFYNLFSFSTNLHFGKQQNFYLENVISKKKSSYLKFFKKKKNVYYNTVVFNYTYIYLIKFFEYFFKKKVFSVFKKVNFLLLKFKKNKFLIFLKKKFYKDISFLKDKNAFNEMVEVLWLTFFLKESNFFLN